MFGKGGKVTDKQAEALKRKLEEGDKLRLELGRLADEASWFFGYYAKRIDLEVEKARREAMSSPRSPPSSSSSSRPPPHPRPPPPAALEGMPRAQMPRSLRTSRMCGSFWMAQSIRQLET